MVWGCLGYAKLSGYVGFPLDWRNEQRGKLIGGFGGFFTGEGGRGKVGDGEVICDVFFFFSGPFFDKLYW